MKRLYHRCRQRLKLSTAIICPCLAKKICKSKLVAGANTSIGRSNANCRTSISSEPTIVCVCARGKSRFCASDSLGKQRPSFKSNLRTRELASTSNGTCHVIGVNGRC